MPKSYRHPELDQRLRIARTIHEAKILSDTRKLGISTPIVYYIDVPNATIFMEYIDGVRIKELLYNDTSNFDVICRNIGRIIATLHKNNIIHGDLTTSNLIEQINTGRLYLLDFGLAEYSTTLEDRGVDLHLLQRVFQSTHFRIIDTCFSAILQGYKEVLGEKQTVLVLQRLEEIKKRGRYH